MKNPLTVITNKPMVRKVTNTITSYVKEHEGGILTGGTIAFNAAGIITTYRNSPKIHSVISITKERLYSETDVNERKRIVKEGLKEIVPLLMPIISFFALSTTCAVVNNKRKEAKIAFLTEALSMAKLTISEYDTFKKEVKEQIGEEKFNEIRDEVQSVELDKRVQNALFVPRPNEEAVWFPYIGQWFSSTDDRIIAVFDRVNDLLKENGIAGKSYGHTTPGGSEFVRVGDICEELGVEDIPEFAYLVGYDAGRVSHVATTISSVHLCGKSYTCLYLDTKPNDFFY